MNEQTDRRDIARDADETPPDSRIQSWIESTAERQALERARDERRAQWLRRMPGARRRAPARIAVNGPDGGRSEGEDPLAGLPDGAKVLWLQADHLGDVLLRGPALAALRARIPGAQVTLAVGPWSRAVAAGLPGIDDIHTVAFPAFARRPAEGPRRGTARLAPYGLLLSEAARLRRARFDAAIVGRDDDTWCAWLAALAGIPRRIGHAHPTSSPFLTHALAAPDRPAHVTAAGLALVGAAAPRAMTRHPLSFTTTSEARAHAAALLRPLTDDGQRRPLRIVAIHPGSGSPIKRWNPTAWAQLVGTLPQDTAVVITGGPGEAALAGEVVHAIHAASGHSRRPMVLDLAGRTSVAQLAALFARCALVLGPDSGPLHLAVAVGSPTVHLYGPADAARFGPWGSTSRHRVVASSMACAPCGVFDWPHAERHPCVQGIEMRLVRRELHGDAEAGPD